MGAGVAAQFCNYFKYVEFAWGKQISKLDPDYGFLLDGPRNWGNNSIYPKAARKLLLFSEWEKFALCRE